jgi:O-antigen ligase
VIVFYYLVTIMPLDRDPLWAKIIGGATLIKYVGLFCLGYAVIYLGVRRRPPRFFETIQARIFVVFILITFASYWLAGSQFSLRSSPFISYLSMLILFFVTLTVVDSPARLRWVLLMSIAGVAKGSLFVIREWQKAGFSGNYRPGWVVGDPNYFGISVLVCLPIAFYLLESRRPRWERLFCLGCIAVVLLGLVSGQSRGAFLGLMVELMWVLWHSRNRVKNMALLAFLLIPLLVLAPSSPLKRFFSSGESVEASTENHVELLKAGLRMVAHNPVVGVGLGNFRLSVPSYEDPSLTRRFMAHDAYLEIAAEMGLPTLLFYSLILYFSFRTLGKIWRTSAEPILVLGARGVQAGLLGSSVAQFFVSGQYQKLYWLMIFLSMAIYALAREAVQGAGEPLKATSRSRRVWTVARPASAKAGWSARAAADSGRK